MHHYEPITYDLNFFRRFSFSKTVARYGHALRKFSFWRTQISRNLFLITFSLKTNFWKGMSARCTQSCLHHTQTIILSALLLIAIDL